MWSRERVRRGHCVPRKVADAGRHVKRCRFPVCAVCRSPWDDAVNGTLEGRAWPSPRVRRLLVFLGGAPGRSAVVPGPPVTHRASPRAVPRVVARLLAAPPAARSEKPLLGRRRQRAGGRGQVATAGGLAAVAGGLGFVAAAVWGRRLRFPLGVLVPKSLPDRSSRWEILKEADYVRNHITALPVVMVIELFTPKKLM